METLVDIFLIVVLISTITSLQELIIIYICVHLVNVLKMKKYIKKLMKKCSIRSYFLNSPAL